MDDEWLMQFDFNATTALPEHQICCWSKDGFSERAALFPELINKLHHVTSVLDVGCGTGYYCRLLDKKGYSVTGVDYAPNMLKQAKQRAPHIEFKEANGYNLPFPDQSFDLVISLGALQCLEDDHLFIAELKRVAKKAIILSTLRKSSRTINKEKERNAYKERAVAMVRTYHPDDILDYFKTWHTEIITKNLAGRTLADCFFLIARREQ